MTDDTTVFLVATATLVPEFITFCVAAARAETVFAGAALVLLTAARADVVRPAEPAFAVGAVRATAARADVARSPADCCCTVFEGADGAVRARR